MQKFSFVHFIPLASLHTTRKHQKSKTIKINTKKRSLRKSFALKLFFSLFTLSHKEVVGSRRRRCSFIKSVPKNFEKFTEKHLCRGSTTLLKKILWHRYFQVNFPKFLQNTSGRLLLNI